MAIKFGTLDISKILFGSNQEVAKIFFGSAINPVYQNAPSFSSSTWTFINQVAIAGQSANFWAVGDTKEDTGTDNNIRVFRVADLSGMYGKDIVIEEVGLEAGPGIWNENTNIDDDNCSNNYGISTMRTTILPLFFPFFSSELQGIITNTTYKVSKNGNSSTLLELTDKLFLAAGKEIGHYSYSRTEENNALTTWAYWTTHTANDDYKKIPIGGGTIPRQWWTRSPERDATTNVCYTNAQGAQKNGLPSNSSSTYFSPAFTLGLVVDATLGNNSWDTIRAVAEKGDAANYWAVGDIKNDTGTDSNTRTYQISHIGSIYNNKKVVFEQVGLENAAVWNSSSSADGDGAYNDYDISNMRTYILPTTILLLSSELQNALTNTTYKVAKNGNSTTLLDLTDKLFLAAEKEMFTSRQNSRTEEFTALTTWQYWTTHTSNSDRVKYQSGTAKFYWLRSPYSGGAYGVCFVSNIGNADLGSAYGGTGCFAPCFSF